MGIHLMKKKWLGKAGFREGGGRNKPRNFWGALQCFERHKGRIQMWWGTIPLYNAEALWKEAQMPTNEEYKWNIYINSIKCIEISCLVPLSRILEQA